MKARQQSLFDFQTSPGQIQIPAAIARLLEAGAALSISCSGGKDSDAMARALVKLWRESNWPGECYLVNADLGRIEWLGVIKHLQRLSAELNVPLVIVKRPQGGMIDRWYQRGKSRPDAPPWSSNKARFCTSELKTAQIDKEMRRHDCVISAVGIRADESSGRGKKPAYQVRRNISAVANKPSRDDPNPVQTADLTIDQWLCDRNGRLALTWHPILHWSEAQVWHELGHTMQDLETRRAMFWEYPEKALTGFNGHWAYLAGSTRLSCSQCVLASRNDITVGALFNPAVHLELKLFELETGYTFQQGTALSSLDFCLSDSLAALQQVAIALKRLNLIAEWDSGLLLNLLQNADPAILAFWTESALMGLDRLHKEGLTHEN